jgi:acetyl-CoA carboxylase carboxyl transferase subunit alpha
MYLLPFEKSIYEIEKRIEELEKESINKNIDLNSSIEELRKELNTEIERIFSSLSRWEIVQLARHRNRPKTIDYVRALIPDYIYFCGDRLSKDDEAIFAAMGTFEGRLITVIGHNKGKNTKENIKYNFGMANPEGYRKALRIMKLAEKFNSPIVTIIDTQGAFPGAEAEEHGQAEAIAKNLRDMFSIKVPIICIVVGEGGSGGALGIGVGDKLLMMKYSMYSVISPEGCATILWRDSNKASEAAELLKLTAVDLSSFKLVDEIIEEPPGGAHRNPKLAVDLVKSSIKRSLDSLENVDKESLINNRYEKYKKLASYEQIIELKHNSTAD